MLHFTRLMAIFLFFVQGCTDKPPPGSATWVSSDPGVDALGGGSNDDSDDAPNGGFILPFLSGEYWVITQTYNEGSHVQYGFEYGDDSYALDLSQSGCESYGKPVTPVLDGEVMAVFKDGEGDHGYGNSILVDHGHGMVSRYAHLSEVYAEEGEQVTINSVIAAVGNSGNTVGSSCPDYPGSHLHMVIYQDKVSIKPEPLSGISNLAENCWISRDGDMECNGNPGDYDPGEDYNSDDSDISDGDDHNEIEDEGELDIRMLTHNPSWGTAQETEFVWVARVESPNLKPEVTLTIYNERDAFAYDFPMETESQESPWVFIYQKDLRDAAYYTYWASADNGDGTDQTSIRSLNVDATSYETPDLLDYWAQSLSGDREYEWRVSFESDANHNEAMLNIVNPNDDTIYDFKMDLWNEGDLWTAGYEKVMNEATVYPYWMTVDNGESIATTKVGWLKVND